MDLNSEGGTEAQRHLCDLPKITQQMCKSRLHIGLISNSLQERAIVKRIPSEWYSLEYETEIEWSKKSSKVSSEIENEQKYWWGCARNIYHPDSYYRALGSFSMQRGLPLGSPGTIPGNQKFSNNLCGMTRTINWPRNSVYHHDDIWRMGTKVQKQLHFTEKQELVVWGKNKSLYTSGERKIDYSIGMVTSNHQHPLLNLFDQSKLASVYLNWSMTTCLWKPIIQWQSHTSKANQSTINLSVNLLKASWPQVLPE